MVVEGPPILLELIGPAEGLRILNYGSSTEEFYKRTQPYIWTGLLEPLMQKNTVVNADLKAGPGVDVVCTDNLPFEAEFDMVLCTSLLEHVQDLGKTVAQIKKALKRPGVLICEVPSNYPYHPDPIDTMLRIFTREEWRKILPGFTIVDFRDIAGKSTAVRALI